MTFGKRLTVARQKCGYSAEDVAFILDIKTCSLIAYEQDIAEPSPDTVLSLVKLYKVSPYFICGLTDIYSPLVSPADMIDLSGLSENNKKECKEYFLALCELDAAGL